MKNISLLAWLTQLGLSVVVTPALLILLAVWLRDCFQWGAWVIWVSVALSLYFAVNGFIAGVRTMSRLAGDDKKKDPPVAFNDHH